MFTPAADFEMMRIYKENLTEQTKLSRPEQPHKEGKFAGYGKFDSPAGLE